MIIAIFGSSCTGKTSVARPLAEELGLAIRSCGEEIKKRAKALSISVGELPDEVHSVIDNETVTWVSANEHCIVEGRFLDYVLSSVNEEIVFIQLTTSDNERLTRMLKHRRPDIPIEDLRQIDEIDQRFRERHYNNISKVEPWLTIDTSNDTVAECVKQIILKVLALEE
jgi:cytidylate kinase